MNRTFRIGKLVATVALAVLTFVPAWAADNPIYDESANAHQQVAAAIAEATKSGKNVVLDFGANWCGDCHALDAQMHSPDLAPMIEKNYVVVHVDVGRFTKNQDLAKKYNVPLNKGIPALAILDSHGNLLFSQSQGEFEDARHLGHAAFTQFFDRWKPKG